MKDEIKEILDRAKKLKYKCDCCEEIAPGKYMMRNDKQTDNLIEAVYIIDKLLDYITNLQESEAYYYGQYKDYKSRNEKAIEYIKQYREIYYPDEPLSEPQIIYHAGVYDEDFDEEKLLNILQGEDKE